MSLRERPMFPLGTALLPGGLLPLHVFEPRYRVMIQHCLDVDGPPEFGQVLIMRGRETGGGDERSGIGTVARIVRLDALDDGRCALLALGTQRIRVERWLDDDPYPRAIVEDWPDELEGTPAADDLAAAARRVAEVLALAAELERSSHGGADAATGEDAAIGDRLQAELHDELADDPVLASYHLATMAPIGPADRHRLLGLRGPRDRLRALDEVLDDVEAMLRFRLS